MDNKIIILTLFGGVLFLIFLVQALRSKTPIRNGFISMLLGAGALVAANCAGIAVAVNIFTVLISLTLGIPGVALMLGMTCFV